MYTLSLDIRHALRDVLNASGVAYLLGHPRLVQVIHKGLCIAGEERRIV